MEHDVIEFLKTEFEPAKTIGSMFDLVHLYEPADAFLRISKVEDKKKHEKGIETFEANLSKFQEVARETALSIEKEGDSESFFAHVLYFYFPKIIKRL